METSELIKKVRKIEIKTRGLSNHIFAGEYHSAFKGKGMTFSEVREYQFGDDIRNIDWNVTARFNIPFVKIYEEERELTVMLLIDLSGSSNFGSKVMLKRELITELAAVLSFSAIQNNDKIGVIIFTDKIEKFIPPKKGKQHILRIIRELIDFEPENTKTNIGEALKFFNNTIKKRSTAFLISDFMDLDYQKKVFFFQDPLKIAGKKHDLIALRVSDKLESVLPNAGLIQLYDNESAELRWIDSSSKKVRNEYFNARNSIIQDLDMLFKKNGIDFADVYTHEDYVKPLMNLFKRR